MRTYDVGDEIELKSTFKNNSKVLTDPTTTTLLLKVPDTAGTETSHAFGVDPDVLNPSTGLFTYKYTVTNLPGTYSYRWNGTGDVQQSGEQQFLVRATSFTAPI